jgi:hypothetical protein
VETPGINSFRVLGGVYDRLKGCAYRDDGASENVFRVCRLRSTNMLWTIFVVLFCLWLLGMVSSYTMGGFIHLLLVVAIAVVLIRVIQGRRIIT